MPLLGQSRKIHSLHFAVDHALTQIYTHGTHTETLRGGVFHIYAFLRVSSAYSLSRYCTISLPPRLCQSLFLFRPGNVLARGGHRVIGFIPEETGSRPWLRPGTTVSRNPRRLGSVASTACRRRLSNVLSSDNYADEAVSYDNAAEDGPLLPARPRRLSTAYSMRGRIHGSAFFRAAI